MKHLELRKKMTGRTKIEKMLNNDIESFTTEVSRYGTILSDNNWETSEGKACREKKFFYNGFVGSVYMRNGQIQEVGLTIQDNRLIKAYIKNDFKPL